MANKSPSSQRNPLQISVVDSAVEQTLFQQSEKITLLQYRANKSLHHHGIRRKWVTGKRIVQEENLRATCHNLYRCVADYGEEMSRKKFSEVF
jgi:hypothetical protein